MFGYPSNPPVALPATTRTNIAQQSQSYFRMCSKQQLLQQLDVKYNETLDTYVVDMHPPA